MSSSAKMLSKIENLLLGKGSNDFRLVESLTRYFCPFEAVGMVRQEIRHSNFLAYILDPARPHGFSDVLLRALVLRLRDEADHAAFGKLDLHFRAMTNARVFRERQNIDVLIEIPPQEGQAGIVVALELKIDAAEGVDQLQRYRKRVIASYPSGKWNHLFGFITKDGATPYSAGEIDDWVSLSWEDLLTTFETAISCQSVQGRGAEMFQDYARMMRRHNMSDGDANPRLSEAVRNLWAHHKEVLVYLIENRPDAISDLKRNISDDIIVGSLRKIGISVGLDDSDKKYRRFYFPELIDRFKRVSTGSWIKKSKSVFWLEIIFHPGGIYAAIVVGPSDTDNAFRRELIDQLRVADAVNSAVRTKKWTHMFAKDVVESEEDAMTILSEKSPQEAANAVADRIASHVADLYPKLEKALESANRQR